ncbi:glycosyltransferase family 39 protein, partial [Patescibacteria group bacterium]|nr:glycosyltransferase family 39 protein [Patescibacteria group bacterium]
FKIPTPLLVILLLGLFLRIFKFSEFFQFNHEQDLQAWIVKDILINKHPRLIGQETSIVGLFIGPLYYYLLVPFFAIFNFDPRASIIPVTLISLATIASVYFVLTKLFDKKVGTIGALLYATSPAIIFLDRWAVPTVAALLWTVWFFYVVMEFLKGRFQTVPILIVLIGLIWHIHIAFVPLLLLVPVAILLSKKDVKKGLVSVNKKCLVISLATCFLLLIPFIAFEFRHNFQQVKGLLGANRTREGQARELRQGYYKVEVITEYMNRVVWSPVFYQTNLKNPTVAKIPLMLFIYLGLIVFLSKKKKLNKKEITLMFLWIAVVFLGLLFSERIISDYYFNNLIIISVVVFSLSISYFLSKKLTKRVAAYFLMFLAAFGVWKVVSKKIPVREFEDREAIVEFITADADKNNYPCVAINYIGDVGIRYGYRYLFWWKGVDQIIPGNDVPVYSIVQPASISESEIEFRSGEIGVILPREPNVPSESVCQNPSKQLLPLNGFVN